MPSKNGSQLIQANNSTSQKPLSPVLLKIFTPFSLWRAKPLAKFSQLPSHTVECHLENVFNILLSNRHDKICKDIICKLSNVSQICLTMDIWSNLQMSSILGVTAHLINNFNLESFMLVCCCFHDSHTGENILH